MSDVETPTTPKPLTPTSPLDWIRELAAHNPQAATILLAGVASFAAVVAVVGMGIDLQSTVPSILVLVAVGIGLIVFAGILGNRILFPVLQWFVVILGMLWVVLLILRLLFPGIAQLDCAVYFWRECAVTADLVAIQQAEQQQPLAQSDPGPPIVVPISSGVERGKYEVYVQFAGVIQRDDMRQMMGQLTDAGWNVQGVAGGGERTASADGYLEVRYASEADATAAEELAKSLVASGRLTALPDTVLTAGLQQSGSPRLEVWIGRNFGLGTRGVKVALQALGLYAGPIDDVSDAVLQQAVRQFQAQQGLVPDGLIGPRTVQKLLEVLPDDFSFDTA